MNDDFAMAMRRSLQQTRASNPAEATRIIQQALRGEAPAQPAPEVPKADPRPRTARPTGAVEDAEVLETVPPRRRTFAEVMDGQARRPAGQKARLRPAPGGLSIPEGGRFDTAMHDTAHGARSYLLYTPSHAAGPVTGLVMMLHGCTQSAADFATGTAMIRHAEARGLALVFPEQPRSANQNLCWNWFRAADQTAHAGEPALLASLVQTVARQVGAPEGRVFVAGLSAGGAMAAILGRTHPEVFAAVGVHSGLAPGAARDMVSAFAAMRGEGTAPAGGPGRPTIVFHGLSDRTVAPANGRAVAGPLRDTSRRTVGTGARSASVTAGLSAEGHRVELWEVAGGGHTWFGGDARGSHTDPAGPDASAQMLRFFCETE